MSLRDTRHLINGVLLAVAIVIVYWPVHTFEFINFDDDVYVTQNPMVATGLRAENVVSAFTTSRGGHWHPLTWISHMVDVSLFGVEAGAHHLTNVGLHLINTLLLYALLVSLTRRSGMALAIAAIFGLHPMRMESVAWISERKDVLSMLFGLSTIHSYLWYTKAPGALRALATMGLFSCALLAKPTMVVLPLLLLLLDYWPLNRAGSLRAIAVEKIPLLALALCSTVVTTLSQHRDGGLSTGFELSVIDSAANAFMGYQAYLGKLFVPLGFGIFYPIQRYPVGTGIGAGIMIALLTAGAARIRSAHPAILVGWLWFLIAPLPVIGFVQFGGQAYADRWSYLPHIGLLLASAFSMVALLQNHPRALRSVALLAPLLCALITAYELPHWRTSETIFRHTLTVSPDNFMAHTNLGSALDQAGRLSEAALHFEEAVRLSPRYPEALNNLGTLRARQGRLTEARGLLEQALAIRPSFIIARYNYGLALSHSGETVKALSEWVSILREDPSYKSARTSLHALSQQVFSTCNGSENLAQSLNGWTPTAGDVLLKQTLVKIEQRCTQ